MSHGDGFGSASQSWVPQGPPPQGPPPQGPPQGQVPQSYALVGRAPQTGYPAQPNYYAQPSYYGEPAPKTPAIAIVGLILAFILPPVGLILSLVAISRARRAGSGRGLAIGGIVVGTLLTILGLALVPLIMNAAKDITDARAALVAMQSSLVDDDCASFMETTTPRFREQMHVTSCDDFQGWMDQAAAGGFVYGNAPVTAVEVTGDTAVVSTVEALDSTGRELQHFDYRLVRQDGTWLVDLVGFGS